MTRNRASAKAAGARFERSVADYLAEYIDERIDRRVKTGAKDKGDIGGLYKPHRDCDGGICGCGTRRIVLEVKDYGGRFLVGPWLNEAETERLNDNAEVGAVVAKRRGTTNPGDQVVLMTLRDLVALLETRPPA